MITQYGLITNKINLASGKLIIEKLTMGKKPKEAAFRIYAHILKESNCPKPIEFSIVNINTLSKAIKKQSECHIYNYVGQRTGRPHCEIQLRNLDKPLGEVMVTKKIKDDVTGEVREVDVMEMTYEPISF